MPSSLAASASSYSPISGISQFIPHPFTRFAFKKCDTEAGMAAENVRPNERQDNNKWHKVWSGRVVSIKRYPPASSRVGELNRSLFVF